MRLLLGVCGSIVSLTLAAHAPAFAQVTREDYARAERFLPSHASQLVFSTAVTPNWIDGTDRFWYRNNARDGKQFVLVDPVRDTHTPAFDHVRLAAALSIAAETSFVHIDLPFDTFEFEDDGRAISFDLGEQRWRCGLSTYGCTGSEKPEADPTHEFPSPDREWAAFTQDHNLFIRSLTGRDTIQLTHDGEPYYDYGSEPEGRTTAVTERRFGIRQPPSAIWSPDSKLIVTHRLDQRDVAEMHLVQSVPDDGSFRPVHHAYRYALPGDSVIPRAELVIVDIASRTAIQVDADPLIAHYRSPFAFQQIWWSADGAQVYVLNFERGDRSVRLQAAKAATGETRTILEERGPTQVDLNPAFSARPNVRILGDGAEFIWFSERDGWAHLYLYDGAGALQNRITSGSFVVHDIVHVDEPRRLVYFTAGGREPGRDPYYRHLYRVGLDGSGLELLTPEDADHTIIASPTGRYWVDTYSRVDTIPVSVLRDTDGRTIRTLEVGDLTELFATGWEWPERFMVKARDDITDLHGVIFRPTNFDSTRRYPVLDAIYPGPQINRVPKTFPGVGTFDTWFWHAQALAELGFVVAVIDGMGTPFRSKRFHDVSYGNLQDAGGLDDHIGGFRQLAASHPYLDLSRVGIYGFSGGGFASAHAILTRPDFYKVAVSAAGNHDQRGYIVLWGEKYHGPLEGDNYVQQANPTHAANLQGKLLLVWGDMDDNVSPSLTIQLVDALIKANKDFDLLVMPNRNHGFGNDPYFVRRRWDYFVEHLRGVKPPTGFRISEPTAN